MITTLSTLTNTHRKKAKIQRVGRGVGSKRGKTCGRGHKGDKARMGYKTRPGYEGGQLPLYRKLPCRGFSNKRFQSETLHINLGDIQELYEDGETVNLFTLYEKGYATRSVPGGLRVLGHGDLTKKVQIEAKHFSKNALEKIKNTNISHTILSQ